MRRRQAIKSIGAALGSLPFFSFETAEGESRSFHIDQPDETPTYLLPEDMSQEEFEQGLKEQGADFVRDEWVSITDFGGMHEFAGAHINRSTMRIGSDEEPDVYRVRACLYPPETFEENSRIQFGIQTDAPTHEVEKYAGPLADKLKEQIYQYYVIGVETDNEHGNVPTVPFGELH